MPKSITIKPNPHHIIYRLFVHLSALLFSATSVFISSPALATTLDYSVNVAPALSLTLSSPNVSLRLNPTSKTFDSGSLDVSVATNNLDGYRLYISSNPVSINSGSSSVSDTTSLINAISSTDKIETLPTSGDNNCSSGCSESNFPINKWGYKITNGTNTNPAITSTTNYYPFALNTWINYSAEPVNDNTATLSFASKIDYNKPSGIYERTFDFKALPQVTQTYMQNMDPNVCTEDPTIVIDARDEHPYIVQRLADNKCWMLDNLDLDLTDRTIVDNLTTANTNINTTADPYALESLKNGYRTGENCSLEGANCEKYATAGLEYHNWTSPTSIPVSPKFSYSQPLVNKGGMCNSTCVGDWQNANYTHNTILNKAGTNNTIYKGIDLETGNPIGGPGNYRIGIYYNYCAASAGTYCYGDETSGGTSSGNATSDICPAGWHIPSIDGSSNGDYLTLCAAIKGNGNCFQGQWNEMDITNKTSMQYELSLPLSGRYTDGTNLSAQMQGLYGMFWTSNSPTTGGNGMRNMLVRSSGVHLNDTYDNNRSNGYSIRCVSS